MLIRWLENEGRFEIDEMTKARFRKSYENFDSQLRNLENWYWAKLLKNPKEKKKNLLSFLVNNMNRHHGNKKSTKDFKKKEFEKNNDKEFNKKMEKAKEECAPPPEEWREMMRKLKNG